MNDSIPPGTSVLVSDPEGRPQCFLMFQEPAEDPLFEGDPAAAKMTFGMAALYLWVMSKDAAEEAAKRLAPHETGGAEP